MLKISGFHIGDSWYFVKKGICHCYYLTCPDMQERHTSWDIGHAVSTDLVHWKNEGIVLKKGKENEWDFGCLATGSVIEYNHLYWMAYTGKWNSERTQIGLAVSTDLYQWEKCSWNPVTEPDGKFYSLKGKGVRRFSHWRDGFMLHKDGFVYMVTCATDNHKDGDACAALGLARTHDMHTWEYLEPPVIDSIAQELECPQICKINGKYILLFSCFYDLFSEKMKQKYGERLRQTSYYMQADDIFGPYRFVERFDLLSNRCEDFHQNTQYANQAVFFNDRWHILGTVWSEDGDYIADPVEAIF